jgi:uncharacterized protein YciI
VFIILLRFSSNRDLAGRYMPAHRDWIQQGFDDGAFVLVGSIQPQSGGAILAQADTLTAIQERVSRDPFVTEDVVQAEIIEVSPARTDGRLDFLASGTGSAR